MISSFGPVKQLVNLENMILATGNISQHGLMQGGNIEMATLIEEISIEDRLFLKTEGGIKIPVPKSKLSSVEIGQKIAFGFRAEDIVPVKFGNKPQQFWDMKSKVNLAEPLGTETLIFTNLGNIEIVSRMFTPELVKAGDILDFSLNLDRTYLFDNSTGRAI